MRNTRLFTFLLALLFLTSSSLAFGSPTIAVSPTSITANSGNCTNYPANQNVTISNSGSGTLASPTIGTVTYSSGASDWLNLWITGSSAPYTLTVEFQTLCGLANGTYTATIPISSSGASNSPVNIPVTLTIGSSSTPTISLSPTSLSFSATAGGSNPAAQDVTVSNSGGGTLASPTTSITYSEGSGWLSVSCTGSSAPYSCSTQPTTGSLASGTYDATVNVYSSGATNSPQSYTVAFTVNPASSPTIGLSPTSITANSGNCANYPANQNVTISNSGSGTLATPTIGTVTYSSGASDWLNLWITGSSAPYTLTVEFQTLCGLANGTYTATIPISSSGASNSPVNIPVTLTIGSSSTPTISLSPTSLSFSATAGGSNPAAQDVTVSNSGGGTLASPTTSITYSEGSGWLSVSCTGSSAPYSCSTQPTTGSLASGTYDATVNVSSSGATNSPQSYSVAFTVNSGSVCTITTASGTCGPYSDSSLSASYEQITQNDVWNPPSTWSQTMYTTSPGDWYIEANFPTDSSGAIHTYPSAAINYYNYTQPTIDSYSYMYSSFATTPDTSSTTVSDAGFDIWLNDWAQEVMIQTQLINTPACTTWMTVLATNVSFGGSNGVPTATWNLCRNGGAGSEIVWQYTDPNGSENFGVSSSSVDIYSMLEYLETNGYIATGSTFTQTCYGFEISTTGGLSKDFTVSNWTQTASH